MTLHCIDKTAGELSLVPGLFQLLRGQGAAINLYTENDYGALLSFVAPNKINRGLPSRNTEGISLYCFSQLSDLAKIPPDALCFPILRRQEAEQYEEIVRREARRCIPLDRRQMLLGYVHGELTSLQDFLARRQSSAPLAGVRVLVSAGPTAEDLDPVRYLTNRSSGKMGLALARAAFVRGAEVRLVLGASTLQVPQYLPLEKVRSAGQMAEAILKYFSACDVYVGAAAIADFTPSVTASDKIKKRPGDLKITLQRTLDVIKELGQRKERQFIVGFSVETSDEIENSFKKMETKNLDMIVVNNPKQPGAAFAADTNRATILYDDRRKEELPLMSKYEVSALLWERISQRLIRKK